MEEPCLVIYIQYFTFYIIKYCICAFSPSPLTDLQYSADAQKVSLLLKAPLYFDLEMYNSAQWLEKVGGLKMWWTNRILLNRWLKSLLELYCT